ncbi:DNA polymerase-3 subunit epsilon [Pustulibacterium marinum]|uniref:DNA polymerase-3 subunit epsilon n=1 Tax=Pustulibacterium marinum TaxID=1224947 RepID=A0A1I7IL75_9FLAO|nr:exonuclease domain-containing protein [Pustulibacterium marinum]SFU73645.1 DNA polymerase-3 subunit epsilon [Pustulibacterium marinum]
MLYAIVDIETTGGKFNEEGITEIAIYKFDGHKVVDQFISLVNPEKDIQPFVVKLTGINNKMLRTAPKFYEIAKRVVEITEDCIIVAHNAKFDYRILRTEFRRLGFDYSRRTLCTVELSKKLIPDKPSYSLGKLVRSLGIPVSDRHRASGDAQATVKLFKLLLSKDSKKTIITSTIKTDVQHKMAPKLLDIVEQIPSVTGVYYIHKADGEIIYIGKSKNIKKRVNQHFTNKNKKALIIQKQVAAVTYEDTGSELIALLKENEEIKINKPTLNRSRKQTLFNLGFYLQELPNGYQTITIEKVKEVFDREPLMTFTTIHEAKNALYKMAEDFKLCHKLLGLSEAKKNCFNYTIGQCNGACVEKEPVATYNERFQKAIKTYTYPYDNMAIVDKGREVDERSVILIKENTLKGFGFYNLNYQVNHIEVLEGIVTPLENNGNAQHIIQSYLRKRKVSKIIELKNNQ